MRLCVRSQTEILPQIADLPIFSCKYNLGLGFSRLPEGFLDQGSDIPQIFAQSHLQTVPHTHALLTHDRRNGRSFNFSSLGKASESRQQTGPLSLSQALTHTQDTQRFFTWWYTQWPLAVIMRPSYLLFTHQGPQTAEHREMRAKKEEAALCWSEWHTRFIF